MKIRFHLLASALFFSASAFAGLPEDLKVPAGFKITVFADNIENARSLALGDKGTVFVGSRSEKNFYAIRNKKVYKLGKDLNTPNGVFFHKGSLYVAEISQIWRYDKIEDNLESLPKPTLVTDQLPKEKHHGWKFIAVGPDEKLYVPVGAPCNVCLEKDSRFASILRMDLDGKNVEVIAHGVRNSVGFDWNPKDQAFWFTENGRDWMGDDKPHCEVNKLEQKGQHFGFPFCHSGEYLDPEFGKNKKCSDYVAPVVKIAPHSAPLGMRFYRGNQYPAEYQNSIYIAEHGSWNRSSPIGYRVSRVKLDEKGRVVSFTPFIEGFLTARGGTLGRPVDVLNMPDGSLLISDDYANKIYQISYVGKK